MDAYEQSLRNSPHLLTLVGMLQQDGIDLVVTHGETEHGVPYVAMLAQGQCSQEVHEILQKVARIVAEERVKARRDADQQ